MSVLHFLNVGEGDCSIIEHTSGRVTVIDVSKARSTKPANPFSGLGALAMAARTRRATLLTGGLTPSQGATVLTGISSRSTDTNPFAQGMLSPLQLPNFENPIDYLKGRGVSSIFRFVLTHPEMDHMDGIEDLFDEFEPENFWDTANNCTKSFPAGTRYRERDWLFYRGMRDGSSSNSARRLVLYDNARAPYYNQIGSNGELPDDLHILAPTHELIAAANASGDFNDASYVVLHVTPAGRILFCGDAHDETWEHLLRNHLADIANVEIMIAPHHGRDSGRDRAFLSAVRPKFTLFGTAPSEHMAYDAWSNRNLSYITNTQAGTIIVDASGARIGVYVTKEAFARQRNPQTVFSQNFQAWYLGYVA